MADDYSVDDNRSDIKDPFLRGVGIAARGLMESVPFVGKRIVENLNPPKPEEFSGRWLERGMSALPYAIGLGFQAPITAGLTAATGSLAGQTAEEMGANKYGQATAELLGGGVGLLPRHILGGMYGFGIPELKDLAKSTATEGYEIGPGASSRQGMSYGSAESAEALERNLTRATRDATGRTGSPADSIDEAWLNRTSDRLGLEANKIFQGKFVSDRNDALKINDLMSQVKGAFGDQASTVENIITRNIASPNRPGGALIDLNGSTFNARDLHSAIKEVNARLGSAATPEQNRLLHELKDELESIAEKNLSKRSPEAVKEFDDWKRKYTAYATLNDLYRRAGQEGITVGGKINVQALRDVINMRGGSAKNSINNPLYSRLAEYGDILRTPKSPEKQGVVGSFAQSVKESPITQSIARVMKPTASPVPLARRAGMAAVGPAAATASQLQTEQEDPYAHLYEGGP